MDDQEFKNLFVKIFTQHIDYDFNSEAEFMKFKIDSTELDSLMLMEIIVQFEDYNVKIKDSFITNMDSNLTFGDVFNLMKQDITLS